ncbi:MAG: MFS transporter [Thermovenabulum sp.]|uniref:MFS transporter n=1 Tax=Thermovenabulum sp. TaxID=3100335 RepID=UPI003C7BF056
MIKEYMNLPQALYVIIFAFMINSFGNFVRPFLTLLLTDKYGYSKDYTGYIVALVTFIIVPGSLIGGKLVDTIGRKKIMIIFHLISAVCLIVCSFIEYPEIIIYLLLASSLSLSIASPAFNSMITDISEEGIRKTAFSLSYLGVNLGFALGSIVAGFLYKNYTKLLYLGNALTTIIAMTLIYFFVDETLPKKEDLKSLKISTYETYEEGSTVRALMERPILLAFGFIYIIFSLVYSQCSFSLPLHLNQLFNSNGAKLYGMVMGLNAITVVVFTPFINSITKKYSSLFCVGIAGILFAVGFGLNYFANTPLMFFITTFIWTLGEIIDAVNNRTFIAENSPISHRGRFNSVMDIIMRSGFTVSPMITGVFLKNHKIEAVWACTFWLGLVGAIMMLILNYYLYRQLSFKDLEG